MAQKKTVQKTPVKLSVVKAKPVPPVVRDATGLIASAVASIVKIHGIGPAQAAETLRRAATDAAFEAGIQDVWQALHGTRPKLVATRIETPVAKPVATAKGKVKPGLAKTTAKGRSRRTA